MKKNYAFTLLEVLISIAISTFIILGMTQIYRSVTNFLGDAQEAMNIDRQMFLLFDQMERDLSTAFIPKLHEEVSPKKEVQAGEVTKKTESKKEEDKYYFVGQIYDGESKRINGKRFELFKSVNFINTNPLQVYGQKSPRLVRIMYELIKDKNRGNQDKSSYQLYRKETLDLFNYRFKEPEVFQSADKEKTRIKHTIRRFLVADNIKDFYVEFVTIKEDKEKKLSGNIAEKEEEEIKSFVWGDKKETKDKVPAKVEVRISFWNDKLDRSYSFNCMIPIFSYPTFEEKEEEKKEPEKKDEPKQSGDKKVLPAPVVPVPTNLPVGRRR